jgi:molybdopterin-guanine dinucleotide biosynthesis adapter protein
MTSPPLIAFVGLSNSGKTTFIEKLIPELKSMGLRVGTLKHVGHGFEPDEPGKDTWRHRRAGAAVTVAASAGAIGVIMETDVEPGPRDLLHLFSGMDLVVVEGYKHEPIPKIVVARSGEESPNLFTIDSHTVAMVTDMDVETNLPVFTAEDAGGVAEFVLRFFQLVPASDTASDDSGGNRT